MSSETMVEPKGPTMHRIWLAGMFMLLGGTAAAEAPDYEAHVKALEEKLSGKAFSIVVEKPFVVIGDDAPDKVRLWGEKTVRWAVERLKALYFEKDPDVILDIWLFKDDASYKTNVKEMFGREPSTPYGFYSDEHRALIMNIATGGGTLVHEIVHPFMEVNFPGCPSWFNEGLGSLYEQSAERDGRIVGRTNWRLAGLQQAIRKGKLPSFEKLTATTTTEFYDQDPGTNYAQARYLCYYLQEKGLLVKFYRDFRDAAAKDPSGLATLRSVLGADDMAAFQKEWERWVLELRFP
jgi:hypothetical protein